MCLSRWMLHALFGIGLLTLLAGPAGAQSVQSVPPSVAPLAERWAWAQQRARSAPAQTYWTGYRIDRRVTGNQTIVIGGTGVSADDSGDGPTLRSLLPVEHREPARAMALLIRWTAGETGSRTGAAVEGARVEGVRVQPIDQDFDPGDAPLFWLGDADDPQSIDWLIDRYDGAGSTDAREDLMAAIGAHRAPEHALPFLRRVLTGDAAKDLRTGAAFWIGQQNTPEVLLLLRRTAESDDDAEVRERAVFGIRQVEGPEATDVLAGLARTAESQNIREKAVFWLGQRASDRAAEVLGDVARSTGDTDIQEQAVFAISRLPADQSVPRLIEIARMHPTLQIRKKAIFWLGQSDDDRAVDALLEIARGGG